MTELKSCPFCPDGGIASLCYGTNAHGKSIFGVECCRCGASSNWYYSEEDAIEAWNTRAERTCKPEIENHGDLILTRYPCCGYELKVYRYSPYPEEYFNNCPNCGAKVICD